MIDQLTEQHEAALAQHESVTNVRGLLDATRRGLDSLMKLGDLVTPEDVIREAGNLAGAGASPMELAKLMSTMPENGPGLQQWIAQHDQMVTQKEAALKPAEDATRHHLGLSAMRLLVAHAMGAPQTSDQPSPASAMTQAPQQNLLGATPQNGGQA
jgi:hypothetical protein